MKMPFFNDIKAKRDLLDNGANLFEHCNKLLDHLTPKERDQFRRYLHREFKLTINDRRKAINFRNFYEN